MYGVGDKVVALCGGPLSCIWACRGDVFVVEIAVGTSRLLRLISRETDRGNYYGDGSWWVHVTDLARDAWKPYERSPQDQVGEWIDEVRSWSCH
jgi:hypothetical protein